MMGRTHFAGGLAATAILHWAGRLPADAVMIMTIPFAALVPDLDSPKSSLGCRMWWLSAPLAMIVNHRGMTHSLAGLTIIYASLKLSGLPPWWVDGLALAYASHIVLDMASGGVDLLWPWRSRVTVSRLSVDGFGDTATGLACFVVSAIYWLRVFGWI